MVHQQPTLALTGPLSPDITEHQPLLVHQHPLPPTTDLDWSSTSNWLTYIHHHPQPAILGTQTLLSPIVVLNNASLALIVPLSSSPTMLPAVIGWSQCQFGSLKELSERVAQKGVLKLLFEKQNFANSLKNIHGGASPHRHASKWLLIILRTAIKNWTHTKMIIISFYLFI